jgi:23S rRNA (guanine745-N1)-methyltransferase
MGLKKALYDSAYENDVRADLPTSFELVCEKNLKYNINVVGNENLQALFAMTPYYWRTSQNDAKKLVGLNSLNTDIDIIFSVYKKN